MSSKLDSVQNIIATYGYYAVFFFACIEGEVALLTAGFLCKYGYLSLPYVILTAFLGTVIFEQFVYSTGRAYGKKIIKKFPSFENKARRAMAFLRKYNTAFILMYRFIYGIRNISPLVIGMARVPKWRYLILNVIASAIWASSVAPLGYLFANILEETSSGMQIFQKLLFVIFLGTALSFIAAYYLRQRNKK